MKSIKASRLVLVMAVAVGIIFSNVTYSFAVTLGSGTQSYRLTVLHAVGVADDTYDSDAACTRGEFAKLLVLSSSYNDEAQVAISSAAANDVPVTNANATYIKMALTQGWMRTRLGGNFSPDAPVTLNDAARATLTILGYTDEDFPSDVLSERLSLFNSLGLDEGVAASNGNDALTLRDAVNIIYNLLNTPIKNGSGIYGSAINLSQGESGELNATNVLEERLVGPILVKTNEELEAAFPFDIDQATYYFNGTNSGSGGKIYMQRQIDTSGWLIVYYNEGTKSIWAYGGDAGDDATYRTLRGRVTSIVYDDSNIATPSSVYIDGLQYELGSDEVKFMFSLNGTIQVGDTVVVVLKKGSSTSLTTTDALTGETDTTTATDYSISGVVKWERNEEESDSNVIYAPENSRKYVAGVGYVD